MKQNTVISWVLLAAAAVAAGAAQAQTAPAASLAAQMRELDSLMERIRDTDDPAARGRLVEEHRFKMYESMENMRSMMSRPHPWSEGGDRPDSAGPEGMPRHGVPGVPGPRMMGPVPMGHPGFPGSYPALPGARPGMYAGGSPETQAPWMSSAAPDAPAAEMDRHRRGMEGYLRRITELLEEMVRLHKQAAAKP